MGRFILLRRASSRRTAFVAVLCTCLPLVALRSQSADGGGEREAPRRAAGRVLPPGFGVGIAGGLNRLGGADNAPIQDAGTTELFARYGFGTRLDVRVGAHVSRRRLASVSFPYQLFGAYLEPRYIHASLSPAWAPFLAGQVTYLRESVERDAMRLAATGTSVGAGGGVVLRLWPQVAVEVGGVAGIARFGDYSFRGELAWYQCLNALDAGTVLPQSVEQCGEARGAAAVLCYPPFYPERVTSFSSDCAPPEIPYDGTARSGSFFRLWVAVHFAFAEPR